MGCHHCRPTEDSDDPEAIHVPFGHVPYTPSLPKVMGPLSHFPVDWWFYGGWAVAADDNEKQFTIVLWSQRVLVDGVIFYGIGMKNGDSTPFFTSTDMLGICRFATPTSKSWSTSIEALPRTSMTCKLTSGTLGLRDATYQVDMTDKVNNIQVHLLLKSTVGLVEEGPACMYPGIETIQFNMPAMAILEGSTITIGEEETTQLAKGNIWLDRQSINLPSNVFKPLYIGVWLAITMNDQTSYTIQFVWPKREEKGSQWIVGTDVGYPPTEKTGLEYPSLHQWNGQSPVQGVHVLENDEFNLNILTPSNPEESPHWESSKSGITYCTAWHLSLKGKVYKMISMVPGCEVWLNTHFYEGAAILSDENNDEVGHVFVEQMGYN